MSDRLFSGRTALHAILIVAVSATAGFATNTMRASDKKVRLDRQYFAAELAKERAKNMTETTANQNSSSSETKPPVPNVPEDNQPGPREPKQPNDPDAGTSENQPVEPDSPEDNTETEYEQPAPLPGGIQQMLLADCYDMLGADMAVFVDARNKDDYVEGHIPGAVHLYHYDSLEMIDSVRPDLEQAFFIIVYCNGGDCDDSISLALDLTTSYGFPNDSVYVFKGGMEEWQEAGYPVTTGENRE